MSHRDELGSHHLPPGPTGDLLLAQALDACLRAERAAPGSAEHIIVRQPLAAQAELRELLDLARAVEGSMVGVRPSAEFTRAARARLMQRIGHEHARPVALGRPHHRRRRRWKWIIRASAGLLAGVMATTATITASASALPGDPLYGLKQAQEELSLRLAADDQARVLALLRNADARLDETARLLQQGRTSEAVVMAQRYDQSVERATTALVVSLAPSEELGRFEPLDTKLGEQQQILETIIQSAPEPARPDLREALATTARGRELMADPQPVEKALGLRQSRPAPAAAAPVPTSQAEDLPTRVPTQRAVVAVVPTATPVPPALTVVAHASDESADADERDQPRVARGEDEDSGSRSNGTTARAEQTSSNRGSGNGGRAARTSAESASVSHSGEDDREGTAAAVQPASSTAPETTYLGNNDGGQTQDRSGGQDSNDDKRDDQVVVGKPASNAPASSARNSGSSSSRSSDQEGNGGGGSSSSISGHSGGGPQADRGGSGASHDDGRSASASVVGARPTSTPTDTPRRAGSDDSKSGSSHGSGDGGKADNTPGDH
jgi:hypothetical protein